MSKLFRPPPVRTPSIELPKTEVMPMTAQAFVTARGLPVMERNGDTIATACPCGATLYIEDRHLWFFCASLRRPHVPECKATGEGLRELQKHFSKN